MAYNDDGNNSVSVSYIEHKHTFSLVEIIKYNTYDLKTVNNSVKIESNYIKNAMLYTKYIQKKQIPWAKVFCEKANYISVQSIYFELYNTGGILFTKCTKSILYSKAYKPEKSFICGDLHINYAGFLKYLRAKKQTYKVSKYKKIMFNYNTSASFKTVKPQSSK